MAESTPPPTHPSPLVCLRFIIVSESQGVQYCSYRYREITNDETLIKPTTDEDKLFLKAQASSFSLVRKSLKIIKCYAKLFILKKTFMICILTIFIFQSRFSPSSTNFSLTFVTFFLYPSQKDFWNNFQTMCEYILSK